MRLIDADELNRFIDKWLSKKCDSEGNTTPNEWVSSLKRCVEEQQTAYDVDKVVAELQKEHIPIVDDYTEEWEDVVFLEEAIYIVRKGGICGQCREAGGCCIREDCPNTHLRDGEYKE